MAFLGVTFPVKNEIRCTFRQRVPFGAFLLSTAKRSCEKTYNYMTIFIIFLLSFSLSYKMDLHTIFIFWVYQLSIFYLKYGHYNIHWNYTNQSASHTGLMIRYEQLSLSVMHSLFMFCSVVIIIMSRTSIQLASKYGNLNRISFRCMQENKTFSLKNQN